MDSDYSKDDFFSTDSSDDEMEILVEPKTKNQNFLEETVVQYIDKGFFEHFRVNRHIAQDIAVQFQNIPSFNAQNGQYGNISAYHQILIFLWFAGHQTASFRDVTDRFNIALSSLHRIIRRVTFYLSNLSREVIKWPTDAEKRIIEQQFRQKGFPRVLGAIDGCHIKIDKPQNDPESYINRKGFYSVQMQVVCDHRRKILDVLMGYPGSVHDSRVFRNSPICQQLPEKCENYVILDWVTADIL